MIHLTIFIITGSVHCLVLNRPHAISWTSDVHDPLHWRKLICITWPQWLNHGYRLHYVMQISLFFNVSWWFKLTFIATIFIPSVHSRGKRYLIHDFCDHTTGGKVPCIRSQTHLLYEGSVTWKIMQTCQPLLILLKSLLILAPRISIFAWYKQSKLGKLSKKLTKSLPFHHILSILFGCISNSWYQNH